MTALFAPAPAHPSARRLRWPASIALLLLVAAVFSRVLKCDFTNYDDGAYVTDNPYVLHGLTWPGVRWAFTTRHTGYWIPITWLSLMADASLFGTGPRGFHATNAVLHLGNALLLALILCRATGDRWRAPIAAALWAIHPLRVESVAWVTERKDVLSLFFGLLAVAAYLRAANKPSLAGHALGPLLFALSLAAKPALVTLPVILLLLDVWPLRRALAIHPADDRPPQFPLRSWRCLLLEKIPWLVVAAGGAAITLIAKQRAGAMADLGRLPFSARAANAVVSYFRYLWKSVAFNHLAVFYPLPPRWPLGQVALAAGVVIAISGVATWQRHRRPWIFVGWWWFIIALIPVIGLTQTGEQAMADRFTYFPAIGLVLLVTWSVPLRPAASLPNVLAGAGVGIAVVLLACFTHIQIGYWQNSKALFAHTLEVTGDENWVAHYNLGLDYLHQKHLPLAVVHLRRAVELEPRFAAQHFDLGVALKAEGDTGGAERQFREALRIYPQYPAANASLAEICCASGRPADGFSYAEAAARSDPNLLRARLTAATALVQLSRPAEAVPRCEDLLSIQPEWPEAHNCLGLALARNGRLEEAEAEFVEALRLRPQYAAARGNLQLVKSLKAKARP